jgi:tetratricopeptide (TPR) repeat protein
MDARHRTVALVSLLAAAGIAAAREPEESNALVMTAEIALQRDDCGRASANYTRAAQHLADVKLAARATNVALDCGQFQAGEHAAQRWRELQPSDPGALRALVRAELGLYRIDEARAAFESWLKNGAAAVARSGSNGVVDTVLQVAQQAGAPATLAMLRGVQSDALQTATAQLALADLAIDGWSYREALQYADRALSAGGARAAVQQLLSRAHAGLGEADQAVTAADAARTASPKEQIFAPVDALLLLGRAREARVALETLRDGAATHLQAQRRLGQLAFNNGDYDEARRDFSELLGDKDSSAVAVYYLAAIAERRDDSGTALRGYELLTGTSLESAARARSASILYKEGQHEAALQMLRADKDDSPSARVGAEIAQAQLLANGGDTDQALARIEDALERSPGHPDLLYQKAVLLEKAGRTEAAVVLLESLYRDRPRDSEAANALGFILADHNRDLSRAEMLIKLALQAEPDNPAILDSLGWLEYRRGMAHEALPLLERAFRLAQDGDIGAHWGEVLWSIGEKSKAREAWNRAALADPDNALLKAAQQRAGVPQMPATGTGTSI